MESYPPLFRAATTTSTNPNLHPNIDLPIIDLNHLNVTQLHHACRKYGIFRLINHGIPSSLSCQLFLESKNVLSLPFETKENVLQKSVGYFWGTAALKSLRGKNVNWVEGLHVQVGNVTVDEVEDVNESDCSSLFRSLAVHYGQHMTRVARTIFDALAASLNLGRSLSDSYLSDSEGFLRVYRYPCCPDTSNYFGLLPHTDSSVLSILNQDDIGGLQVLYNSQWFNIAPIADTLVVNLGDMMQAMSDDEYKSVEHRVLTNESKERTSLCFFAFPMEDCVIMSSKYKAFTNREFRAQVQQDLSTYGSKIGLEHFRIKKIW